MSERNLVKNRLQLSCDIVESRETLSSGGADAVTLGH